MNTAQKQKQILNVGIRLFLLRVNKKSISHLILDNFVRYISIDLATLIPMRPYFV